MIVSGPLDVRKARGTSLDAIQDLLRRGYTDDRVKMSVRLVGSRKPWKNSSAGRNPDRTERVCQFR